MTTRLERLEAELDNAVVAQDVARAALASIKRPEAACLFFSGSDYFNSVIKVQNRYKAAEARVDKSALALSKEMHRQGLL